MKKINIINELRFKGFTKIIHKIYLKINKIKQQQIIFMIESIRFYVAKMHGFTYVAYLLLIQ